MVTIFSPLAHVAAVPFVTGVNPTSISTTAVSSVEVAVIVLVAFDVVVVYSTTSASNSGDKTKEPIVSADNELSVITFLLLE